MILEFRLPAIIAQMTGATIECLHATVGEPLRTGAKLLDISIDLGSAFAQECPPISFYRIVMRENAVLRRLDLVPGQYQELGGQLALFSTEPDEPLDPAPARGVRTAHAGIIHHSGMWSGALT